MGAVIILVFGVSYYNCVQEPRESYWGTSILKNGSQMAAIGIVEVFSWAV